MNSRHLSALCLCLCLTLVTGCETITEKAGDDTKQTDSTTVDTYEQAIQLAKEATTDQKAKHLLRAMEIALQNKDITRAQAASKMINPTLLGVKEGQTFERLSQELAALSGTPVLSDAYLLSLTPSQLERFPVSTKARAIALQADRLANAGNYLQAANLRIANRGLFLNTAFRDNQDAIWHALRQIPAFEIMQAGGLATDPESQGWLDLAGKIQQHQNMETQLQTLSQWLTDNPGHSAASVLPGELAMLQQLPTYRPQRMALLLPLTGPAQKAGEAIRDGFIGGYLRSDPDSAHQSEIHIMDSGSTSNIKELYLNLQLQQFDLIVGPLDKEQVDALSLFPEHNPPTLALNYVSNASQSGNNFFQFGLSSEDEIDQILQDMNNTGKERLLVISSITPWADKLLAYLELHKQDKAITIVGTERVNDDSELSSAIEEQLNISESKTRTRNLQNLLGKLEGEPRRRQDVDAILIITTPISARQIKPLLAFHYASDIPVYATSHINSGQQSRTKNSDLNGIRLPEAPWSLNRTLDIKTSAEKFTPPAYTRFFAMGLDAFQLASRIKLMQHFPDSVFQGETGELYMNNSYQIRRRLEWAEFRDGVLISAPGRTQE